MATRHRHTQPLSRAAKYNLMYGDAGGYMSHLSHADRVRVKKAAAKRGLTVTGLLQNVPEPLRERSTAGLRKQALATINAAYKPQEAQLSQRETQIDALDQKRKTDNEYYRNWLATQQATSDALAHTSDAALLAQAGAQHDAVAQRYDAANAAAAQQAASTPGNVSDPSQSTALKGIGDAKDLATAAADIANSQAIAQVARSGQQRQALQASNFAAAAALEAKRQGDTYQSLAKLSDDKNSVLLNKAADINKEVSRLLDNEVTKAQSNQQFGALADKLGVTKAKNIADIKLKKSDPTRKKTAADLKFFKEHGYYPPTGPPKKKSASDKKTAADLKFFKEHGYYPPTGPPKKGRGGTDTDRRKRTRDGIAGIQQVASLYQSTYKGNFKKMQRHLMGGDKPVNIEILRAGAEFADHGYIFPQEVRALRKIGVVVPKAMRSPQGG